MAITCNKQGVWILDDTYKKVNAAYWQYDAPGGDPGDTLLFVWGNNNAGFLGDSTIISKSSPVQIPGKQWSDISGGNKHTLVTKTDGTLWSWGCSGSGQLGDNTAIDKDKSSPIQIPGTQWDKVSSGEYHSLATKTDGTLWSWGSNGYGRLGHNNIINRSSPVQVPGTQWININASSHISVARKTDGTLWSWGYRGCGQLGDNTIITKSSPVQVP